MRVSKKQLGPFLAAIGICAGMVAVLLISPACKDKQTAPPPVHRVESDSFTFLGLNDQTRITDELRKSLQEKLGPEAYATRSTIDLEIHGQGFMASYFPEIDAMNRQLNYPARGRVEHDAIRLTYRYARKKNTPLDFVRLIFSGNTGEPLFFYIRTTLEGPEFLDTLTEKYGAPASIDWTDGKGRSHYWKKNKDYLIVSETTTRIGTPEFHFGFYFSDNIHAYLEKEQGREEHPPAPREAIRKVF